MEILGCDGPVTPNPEICDNGIDDDGDGLIDCADPDCSTDPGCTSPTTEICDNNIDDDGDGAVDCADSDCPACVTCTDGVQNGAETGVDCGGPDCAPCQTPEICNDGIDNDGDGAIDCLDSDCPDCMECEEETVDQNDFENSLGIWIDGGADAERWWDPAYANSGITMIRLHSQSTSSWMKTQPLDLSVYNTVIIRFSYVAIGCANSTDDFWLQKSDAGSEFATVASWTYGSDFQNAEQKQVEVTLSGTFSTAVEWRLYSDATTAGSLIHIDDIEILGCNGTITPDIEVCDNGIDDDGDGLIDCDDPDLCSRLHMHLLRSRDL